MALGWGGADWRGRAAMMAVAALVAFVASWSFVALRGYRAIPHAAAGQARAPAVRAAAPNAAPAPPPIPEPTLRADLTPEQARASNATVPIVTGRLAAAAPYVFAGIAEDRVAATTCLAAAVLYEAGDDRIGEQAVAQVVLNRVRHPAFPKTVCGVVFQGSERSTGCQFTFTCDGALARPPQPAAWSRAQAIAMRALSGFVCDAVGTATHYHADYVVPYWRDSLQKIAQVHAHIFYRWPGRSGQPAPLAARGEHGEALSPMLAALAGVDPGAAARLAGADDATTSAPRTPLTIEGVPKPALKGSIVRLMDADAAQYVLQLDPAAFPGSWAIVGYTICGPRPDCLVMGWTSEAETPRSLPVSPSANRSLAFMYRKSSVLGIAQPYWDCARFARPQRAQCLPRP